MMEQSLKPSQSKQQILKIFQNGSPECRLVRVRRRDFVYTSGECDSMIYYLERGQVNELLISREGKECLIAIHNAGDIFGELCLCGQVLRSGTTVAMQDSILRRIPSHAFLSLLERGSMLHNLVQYLAARIAEQEEIISSLLTVNSELRLAKTLLRLFRRLASDDALSKPPVLRLRQEELAEMVGTTRTRIGIFLKHFRQLGSIEVSADRAILVNQQKLTEYVERSGVPCGKEPADNQAGESHMAKTLDRMTPSLVAS